ncbi:hypothetical protein [Nocardia sp. NPDC057227]|uniref:hypothetical protein n=1 Tax=Nocardia sp. NPDC057227 TaxID=3346056 RepID=UPI00363297A0
MTAPDPQYVQSRLLQAAAMIERRQFVAAEIVRLQAEAQALDATMATAWPGLIDQVAADMLALSQEASGG